MAKAGNQYWKLRSRHGKAPRFASPSQLWEAASKYFEWCDANPLKSEHYVGYKAKRVTIRIPRPFTLSGLLLFLNCGVNYFSQLKTRLKKTDPEGEMLHTVRRIESVIYEQKFQGAVAGIYNVSIIARDLGLMNRKEVRNIEPLQQPSFA